ncbi:hypothetical protein F5Y05DRAFT_350135 [Hypoxylon sp. FL0543]|nr:hypothetical protein F5Y05DRAFT_350135 [Hypoxylon sp. FL0543]
MVNEPYNHRSAGSLRRSGSNANRKHSSGGSSNSGSVLSRVLGSFRHKRQEDKKSRPSKSEGHQLDWIANYKGTHHPDRPLVDKRIRTILPDDEYAAKLERLQERNQISHGLNDRSKSATPPPIQTSIPNFSYSSTSPKGTRGSQLSPKFTRTEWQPIIDTTPPNTGNRTLRSPTSPETVTIQLYPESDLDRGRIVRHIARTTPQYLLPRKAYDPDESAAESSPQESPHKRKRSSADFPAGKTVWHEPRSPIHGDSIPPPPDLTRDSSPASPTRSREVRSPVTPVDEHRNHRFASPEPPRTCPWPGCNAVLVTEQEKADNLCASCHESLYPRESAFFGPNERREPEVDDARLEALHALLGTRVDVAKDVHVDEIHTGTAARLVKSKFSTKEFKLQPAPAGRRRRPSLGPRRDDGSRNDIARHASPSPLGRGGQHIGFQDARWYPSPLRTPVSKPQPQPQSLPLLDTEENDGETRFLTRTGPGDSSNGSSWPTTDSRSAESSDDDDDTGFRRPYEPGERNKDSYAATSNIPPPITNPTTTDERRGNKGNPDPQPEQQRGPSRDTVLYREIEEIIDCYTTVGDIAAEDNERRKADAVASFYAKEPEAVEMRRKGFI